MRDPATGATVACRRESSRSLIAIVTDSALRPMLTPSPTGITRPRNAGSGVCRTTRLGTAASPSLAASPDGLSPPAAEVIRREAYQGHSLEGSPIVTGLSGVFSDHQEMGIRHRHGS